MATLTAEQKQAVRRAGIEPVRVEDPETGVAYVIVREDLYRLVTREAGVLDQSDRSLYEFEDFRPLDEGP